MFETRYLIYGIIFVIFFFIAKFITDKLVKKPSEFQKYYDEILNKEEYKIKSQYE